MAARKPHHSRHKPQGPAVGARPSSDWLFGRHAVAAALANPSRHIRRLLATAPMARDLARDLARHRSDRVAPEIVDRAKLDDMLPGAVHQGIALLVDRLPEPDLAEACAPAPQGRNLVVVLDQVTDPQNVGAILRSAAAFGARAVVTTERRAPAATGTLAKAASGALERVALVRVANLARALEQLADLDYWRIGLDPGAAAPIATARDYPNLALVLGAEGKGLRRLTAKHCDLLVRIPMVDAGADAGGDAVGSLNVSNAAAVALYALAGVD